MDPVAVKPPRAMAIANDESTDSSTSNAEDDDDEEVDGSAISLRRWECLEQSCIR